MEPSKAIFTFYLGKIAIDIKPEAIIQLVIVLLIDCCMVVNKKFTDKTK